MERKDMQRQWDEKGFFILRGLVSPEDAAAIEQETIATIRAHPPHEHRGERCDNPGNDLLIFPEPEPSPTAVNPEDWVAKVFNCHTEGATRLVAESEAITDVVASILGDDIDCFQSQFIFKNPGVIGQPWHQDSYYFRFDKEPQAGVWLALSRATLENGCLWVLPGSQRGPVFEHIPDTRPGASQGSKEIVSEDASGREPVVMEPGDVLFFHSYLMQMSTDNVADERRAAMVYHYGRAGSKALSPNVETALAPVNRWLPVRRARSFS